MDGTAKSVSSFTTGSGVGKEKTAAQRSNRTPSHLSFVIMLVEDLAHNSLVLLWIVFAFEIEGGVVEAWRRNTTTSVSLVAVEDTQ